ncbi:hypothetical protein AB0J90_26265 [Micromonospora sp. NPDC049523]|uniref:hypothetical protein n=1 Tax=Micromonospora sp. NPDC049523 TaxID=3155921 RepID=UPI00342394AA
MRISKKLLSAVVIPITALAMATGTAQAATAKTPDVSAVTLDASRFPESKTITALEPYVKATVDGWQLNAPDSVRRSVPQSELTAIEKHIAATNASIAAGAVAMTPAGTVGPVVRSADGGMQVMARWSGSHGYIETAWYGFKVWFDAYYTDKLQQGLASAGGIAAIITAVGATGGAAAIIGVVALAMIPMVGVCKEPGGDVFLYIITLTPTPGVVCNPL